MEKHKYFELDEFVVSATAKKRGIDNTPSFEAVAHLDELVEKILDPLRAAYGLPIHVSSGYRCAALNKAVGGAATSVHMIGYAADLQVGGSLERFKSFVAEWFMKTGVKFDQVLLEKNARTGVQWVHIGLKNNAGQQRGQIKLIEA